MNIRYKAGFADSNTHDAQGGRRTTTTTTATTRTTTATTAIMLYALC